MAPQSFPQEMVDQVIDEFSKTARWDGDCTPNKCALASLSMVSRAWRGRSQKHLFSVINFREPSSMDITDADLADLRQVLCFTRDLEINGRGLQETLSRLDPVTVKLLRCFEKLDRLSLTEWDSERLGAQQLSTCFRHFGNTVIDLTVEGGMNAESLIFLTSMFPRLHGLQITVIEEETTGIISKEELPETGCFQGSLYLSGLPDHHDFLVFLASSSPKFNTICVDKCELGDGVGELLDSSAATLESLSLQIDGDDPWANPTSLSKCTQLQQVFIVHPWSEATASLLQTIRSPYLEKIVIHSDLWSHDKLFREEDIDVWRRADGELCEAYNQWAKHVTGKIEVTLDLQEPSPGYLLKGFQEDLKRFLPRLIEKVAMTIGY